MKTAISIPDTLFEAAERLAAERRMSRSELYTRAVRDFIEAQKVVGVREKLDALYSGNAEESALEPGVAELQGKSVAPQQRRPDRLKRW